jgi:cell wall-associated NlpC family hydrolase
MMTSTLRSAIVAQARAYLGTPFVHQGRTLGHGVDCVGLPICVARALGLVEPAFEITGYPRQPDGRSLLALCDQHMRRITRAAMQVGDVLVMRFAVAPQHVGIVADYVHGGLSLIHALGTPDGKGRVVEHRLDGSTMARAVAAYTLPGVD